MKHNTIAILKAIFFVVIIGISAVTTTTTSAANTTLNAEEALALLSKRAVEFLPEGTTVSVMPHVTNKKGVGQECRKIEKGILDNDMKKIKVFAPPGEEITVPSTYHIRFDDGGYKIAEYFIILLRNDTDMTMSMSIVHNNTKKCGGIVFKRTVAFKN